MKHFDDDVICRDPACPKIHACGHVCAHRSYGPPFCGWEISHKRRVQVGDDWFCRHCAEKLLKRQSKQ